MPTDTPAEGSPKQSEPAPILNDPENSTEYYLRILLYLAIGIFTWMCFVTLYVASAVFLPILSALVLNFLLSPAVRIMKRAKIPRPIGAMVTILGSLFFISVCLMQLAEPAQVWVTRLPKDVDQLKERFEPIVSSLQFISDTKDSMLNAAEEASQKSSPNIPSKPKPVVVQLESPPLTQKLLMVVGGVTGQIFTTLILLYFLLSAGDRFLEKTIELMPSYQEKWKVVEVGGEIERGVSRYLITITLINTGLGLTIFVAMWLCNMPSPFLWGAMATIFNFVPFIGALVGSCVVGIVSLAQEGSLGQAFLPPILYIGISGLEGNFITPTILGYRLDLSPAVAFAWLVFMGWLWGISGALLAIPLLAIFKLTCDHFKATKKISAFLVQ